MWQQSRQTGATTGPHVASLEYLVGLRVAWMAIAWRLLALMISWHSLRHELHVGDDQMIKSLQQFQDGWPTPPALHAWAAPASSLTA